MLSLALAVAFIACKSRDSGAPPAQEKAQPTVRAVSFRIDVYPVLAKNCATVEGCHGNRPTESVDLDLLAGAAYAQLVGTAAEARKGALRVKPGDPAASFLVDKLAGSLRSGEGKPMPLDVESGAPLSPSPLLPDFIEKILKPWIQAGAPNN
jgi:hypothetical protein